MPLAKQWMMRSPLKIQWCWINLMVEYLHFFLVCHPLILGLCPFSSLHPPQIPKGNGPLFLATEAELAGNTQLGAGACRNGYGIVSETTGISGNPDAVLLPAASVSTRKPPCLRHHSIASQQDSSNTLCSLLPCLALLVFRKIIYSLLSTLFPSTKCKYHNSVDFVLFTAEQGWLHLDQCLAHGWNAILFAECVNECQGICQQCHFAEVFLAKWRREWNHISWSKTSPSPSLDICPLM